MKPIIQEEGNCIIPWFKTISEHSLEFALAFNVYCNILHTPKLKEAVNSNTILSFFICLALFLSLFVFSILLYLVRLNVLLLIASSAAGEYDVEDA